jgi:hypothetical protein
VNETKKFIKNNWIHGCNNSLTKWRVKSTIDHLVFKRNLC